ncbi:MAG: hypothetical protein H6625_01930 [Bdellovibrionaceae bacterium]|nr:hypothetical protein [Pseudobdellovibrionaceae bacterium]
MKKALKIAGFLLVFIVLSTTAIGILAVNYLQSEKGLQNIMQYAEKPLRDHGLEISFAEGSLKLISGLKISNFQVNIKKEDFRAQIKIPLVDLNWKIHPFSRTLNLTKFYLIEPNINAQVSLSEGVNKPEKEINKETFAGFSIQKKFVELPFELSIEDWVIKNLKAQIEILQGRETTNINVSEFTHRLKLNVNNKGIGLEQELKVDQETYLKSQKMKVLLKGEHKLDAFLKFEKDLAKFTFNDFNLAFDLDSIDTPPQIPPKMSLSGSLIEDQRILFQLKMDRFKMGDLKPTTFSSSLDFSLEQALDNFVFHTEVQMYLQKIADFNTYFNFNNLKTKIVGNLWLPQEFLKKETGLSPLKLELESDKDVYQWQAKLELEKLILKPWDLEELNIAAQISLPKKKNDELTLNVDTKIKQIKLDKFRFPLTSKVGLKVSNIDTAQAFHLEGELLTGSEESSFKPPLDFQFILIGEKLGDDLINIEKLQMSLNKTLFNSYFSGNSNLKAGLAEFKGSIELDWPKNYPNIFDLGFQGKLKIPMELALAKHKNLSLQTAFTFKDFSVKKENIEIIELNGKIPINEDLVIENNYFKFSHLLKQNAFERVTFSKILPFLTSIESLRVKKIKVDEKYYGPFVGYVSMNQNLVTINKFDLSLSKSAISGESFLDFQPSQLSFGLLTRFSQLNLGDVLPKKFLNNVQNSAPMNGRTNLVYNLNKNYINGRLDITDISANQLIAILNILDIEYKDDSLNNVRNYLNYAYPTYVGLEFQHNYLDIDMTTNLFKIPTVKSVPIGTQLNDFSKLFTEKIKEIPIR